MAELPDGCVLAYCAGVIDSDGTIGVKRSTYGMRHGNGGQPTYSERVCVKQVEPQAIALLAETFGGYHGITKASLENGKDLFTWQVTDKRTAYCLRALLPYLRIKCEQALNCLALREVKDQSKKARVAFGRGHTGAARRPSELSERMERICQRAHELNRVGRGNHGGLDQHDLGRGC